MVADLAGIGIKGNILRLCLCRQPSEAVMTQGTCLGAFFRSPSLSIGISLFNPVAAIFWRLGATHLLGLLVLFVLDLRVGKTLFRTECLPLVLFFAPAISACPVKFT